MKKYLSFYFIMTLVLFGKDPVVLTLDKAVQLGYESSKEVKKAELDVDSSNLQIKQAFKTGLPSLSLESNWLDVDDSLDTATGVKNQLVLTQPIFQGFQILEGMKSSKNIKTLSEIQLSQSKEDLKLSITEVYLEILRLQEQRKVLEGSLSELDKSLEKLVKMKELGMVTKTDILDIELEKLKVESSIIQTENSENIQILDLKNKIGLPQETEIVLENTLDWDLMSDVDYDKDLERALADNSQIQMAKINQELEKSKEVISRAEVLPTVALQGTYGNTSYYDSFDDSIDPDEYDWTVGVSFSWNVFSFGKNLDGIKVAQNSTKQKEYDVTTAKENIELALKSAYLNLVHLEKQIDISKKAIERSESNYDLQKKKYENQMITSIEFLEAENNLRNSKFNLIDVRMSFYYTYNKYLSLLD